MKHLVLCYHTCPLDEPGTNLSGGMNIFLRGLLPALDMETEVWTRGAQAETVRMSPNVTLRRIPCGFQEPWTRERAHAALPEFVRNAPRDFRPDVVSAHYWMSGVAARELFPDVPMVLAYHTLQATKGDVEDPLGRARAEAELAGAAARVVFFSAVDWGVSRRLLPPLRAAVIRPGFSVAEGQPTFDLPKGFRVLVAARDDPGKNLGAARAAVLAEPGAVLVVAGQAGPSSDREVYLGSLPHHRMADLYASVHAVLCPSDYETFGLVTLEALAAGRPVAVTPGGYWGRVLRATRAGLVTPLASLPEAVRRLTRAPGERGRALASRFTLERCAHRWTALLRETRRRT